MLSRLSWIFYVQFSSLPVHQGSCFSDIAELAAPGEAGGLVEDGVSPVARGHPRMNPVSKIKVFKVTIL